MNIVTYTGRVIDPLNADPAAICIEDIAHALSNVCRFTGHVRHFYSVAQHSVHCSEIVPPEHALTALLHDASEAYLSDVARPIKKDPDFGPFYRAHESRLEYAISRVFGIQYPYPLEVKWADNVMLRSEQRDLMPDLLRVEGEDYFTRTIMPWSPVAAEAMFLRRFHDLTTG